MPYWLVNFVKNISLDHKMLLPGQKKKRCFLSFIALLSFINFTWHVMQLSLLHRGHLKLLTLSEMNVHPLQSGVLQWKEFLEVAWTSFNDLA